MGSHGSEGGPHNKYAHNITKKSSNTTMDFARMTAEYTALKKSLESMEHLISSICRLRLSLVKVKESVQSEDTTAKKSGIIENVGYRCKTCKDSSWKLSSCKLVN